MARIANEIAVVLRNDESEAVDEEKEKKAMPLQNKKETFFPFD